MSMFKIGKETIDQYLKKDDWHFWVNMKNGAVTMPLFQNLEAFWPGTLSMVGDLEAGLRSLHNYHQVWKQYGFTPEFYNVAQGLNESYSEQNLDSEVFQGVLLPTGKDIRCVPS